MEQENYKAIAEIIKKYELDWEAICIELADYFEKDNKIGIIERDEQPFDKEQFLKDCGYGGDV